MEKRKEDRKFAKRIAEKLIKKSNILYPPILLKDIVRAIRNSTDVDVRPREMSREFCGIFIQSDDSYGILYNSVLPRTRARFTIAHELGHIVLQHKFDEEMIYESYNRNRLDWREKEANSFAAYLLMPQNMLKSELKDITSVKITELAHKFYVSEEALRNRLYFSDSLLGIKTVPI